VGSAWGCLSLTMFAFRLFSLFVCLAFLFLIGGWVAAVDAFEAADRTAVGMVEGGFILRDECISRIIKFDSKQEKTNQKAANSSR
jgi:hypothetical protein